MLRLLRQLQALGDRLYIQLLNAVSVSYEWLAVGDRLYQQRGWRELVRARSIVTRAIRCSGV